VAEDEKHLAAVEKVGADFIPLVVECFGVWTPFAFKSYCRPYHPSEWCASQAD